MKQVISIFLSVLLLASSTGIAYAEHFCGDFKMLSEITLGEKQLSCGMAIADPACTEEFEKDHNCCDNEYTSVNTDDNFVKANFDIQLDPNVVATFVSVFVPPLATAYTSSINNYGDYDPPPLLKDISVLYETFLI